MVKVERSYPAPSSLQREKKKADGSYSEMDVVKQLEHDFRGKCYICEIKPLMDPEVEHLIPHKGNVDLKFGWDNLFLSCYHCNSVKNQRKYDEGILDCTKVDPERYLAFLFVDGDAKVEIKEAAGVDEKIMRTAELIDEVFHKANTGIRVYAAEERLKALRKRMNLFFNCLGNYQVKPQDICTIRALRGMIDRSAEFAGYTRTYIRNHKELYSEIYSWI